MIHILFLPGTFGTTIHYILSNFCTDSPKQYNDHAALITADGSLHNNQLYAGHWFDKVRYEKFFNKGFSIRSEAYYQYLYNIPVTVQPSSFSMINMGSGFTRIFADSLENAGTGYNYGLELTVQKYFDKSFFFLFSGTVYDSK